MRLSELWRVDPHRADAIHDALWAPGGDLGEVEIMLNSERDRLADIRTAMVLRNLATGLADKGLTFITVDELLCKVARLAQAP